MAQESALTISQALTYLQGHRWLRIGPSSASVYVRGKWRVSVRLKRDETVESMIVRLAESGGATENVMTRPKPRPKPSRHSKMFLRKQHIEHRLVN